MKHNVRRSEMHCTQPKTGEPGMPKARPSPAGTCGFFRSFNRGEAPFLAPNARLLIPSQLGVGQNRLRTP